MKLYLVRHGQTVANLNKIYAGQAETPLTEQGREQARKIQPVLEKIPFDRVFSSDLSRAVETQKLALPERQAEQTPLLREFHLGTMEGKPFGYVPEDGDMSYRGKRNYVPFGGEDSAMVCRRLRTFLEPLEKSACENVVAFVHNGIMNCMLQLCLGTAYDATGVRSNNCAINVFDYDGEKWRMVAWNYMGEL